MMIMMILGVIYRSALDSSEAGGIASHREKEREVKVVGLGTMEEWICVN